MEGIEERERVVRLYKWVKERKRERERERERKEVREVRENGARERK